MIFFKKRLKDDKGFTGLDLSISVMIIIISIAVIATIIFNLYSSGASIKRNVIATDYSINVLETILASEYSDVTFQNSNTLKERLDTLTGKTGTIDSNKNSYLVTSNSYDIEVDISKPSEKYTNINNEVDNYIKVITVKVSYNSGKNSSNNTINTDVLEISTLKTLN